MIPVLYEDDTLIAVNKPAGALTVRGRLGENEPSLLDQLAHERGEKLFIVHRLDRGTSGVLLFARTAEAHRALNQAFEKGEVSKHYLTLVRGVPPLAEFTIDVALVAARRGKSRPAGKGEAGKPSVTHFCVRERFGDFALLEAKPQSGRAHQIRVHLKYAGFPLAVDGPYAGVEQLLRGELGLQPAQEPVLSRTPLHARSILVPHPATGTALLVEAPLPPDMESAIGLLRSR